MKLSEVPLDRLAVGDRLVSALGTPGYIAGIFPDGQPSIFEKKVNTDFGSPQLLIVWQGSRNWSLHEQAQLDTIEYDEGGTAEYRSWMDKGRE